MKNFFFVTFRISVVNLFILFRKAGGLKDPRLSWFILLAGSLHFNPFSFNLFYIFPPLRYALFEK